MSDTWRALLAPRRAVPLCLVAFALLVTEWLATASVGALIVDLALIAVFCAIAPGLWRGLFAREGSLAQQMGAWAIYTVAGVAIAGVAWLLPPTIGVRWTYVSDPRSLGVLVVLFLVGGWGLGRDIELEAGVTRERARAERLAIDAEQAQILALRAQLDPHFLFNTLNAIAEWCRESPLAAERATLDLAALLREIFDALREPTWTLGREVALLRRLASLYQARDEQRFVFRFDIDDATSLVPLPPLVLLPLFENAIKHGPSAGHAGVVRLAVRTSDEVNVLIENPGKFGGPRDGGEGLSSVQRRLALAYGDRAKLTIDASRETTTVSLRLPCIPTASKD